MKQSRLTPAAFGFPARCLVLASAAALGGCTADISTLSQPSFSLAADETQTVPSPTPVSRSVSVTTKSTTPPNRLGAPVKVAALPPDIETAPDAGQETVEVKKGDTLYGLAKRHGVSASTLRSLNGRAADNLKPGQKLILKEGARSNQGGAPQEATTAAKREDAATAKPETPADAQSEGWSGAYTMKPGDSLYTVAKRHGLKLAELERANDIADARRIRPGAVIKVPKPGSSPPPEQTAALEPAPSRPAERRAEREPPKERDAPPSEAETAPPSAAIPEPSPPPASTGGHAEAKTAEAEPFKLRWPVRGRIVMGFGEQADGTHNDGVDIAVPMGTDVHAAETGTVVYSGSELAGYGNLVLLSHANGWVTAYAHNSEILVERGDAVRRGQIIAKAGNSGEIGQPQVHFELRRVKKPVDPAPFMDAM